MWILPLNEEVKYWGDNKKTDDFFHSRLFNLLNMVPKIEK